MSQMCLFREITDLEKLMMPNVGKEESHCCPESWSLQECRGWLEIWAWEHMLGYRRKTDTGVLFDTVEGTECLSVASVLVFFPMCFPRTSFCFFSA